MESVNSYFSDYANRQVNYAYTLRNWLIGMHLFEFEQKGQHSAEYGDNLYLNSAKSLREKKVKGLSLTMLNTCRQFYLIYSQIIQTAAEQSYFNENHSVEIIQSANEQFNLLKSKEKIKTISIENRSLFLSKLSHSHILEIDVKFFKKRD
jgi:hypothetical protein